MKIIHCSDLHLDSQLETTLPTNMAQSRNYELFETFLRMVEYAHKNNVQVIMICGDLFDTSSPKQTAIQFVLSVIKKYPHITFLYLKGNHDEQNIFYGQVLPSNLKLFNTKWSYYKFGQVLFAGIEFDEHNYISLYDSLHLSEDSLNIVMMHGQIGTNYGHEIINLSALNKHPIDYFALGHIHSYKTGHFPMGGTWCYSGCLDGRGFDETGEKGFVLLDLDIDEKSIYPRFIAFSSRKYHKLDMDITDVESVPDIIEHIQIITSEITSEDAVRITFTGNRHIGEAFPIGLVEQALKNSFYCFDLQDSIRYTYDSILLDEAIGLKKLFIETVKKDESLCEAEVQKVIEIGLKAMRGEENIL